MKLTHLSQHSFYYSKQSVKYSLAITITCILFNFIPFNIEKTRSFREPNSDCYSPLDIPETLWLFKTICKILFGDHRQLPYPLLTLSMDWNLFPFNSNFSFVKNLKSTQIQIWTVKCVCFGWGWGDRCGWYDISQIANKIKSSV